MHDQPSQKELIDAVKCFISDTAMPQLTGRAAFHARVALNVLDILSRDIANRKKNEEAELTRLQEFLECYDPGLKLDDYNKMLCKKIANGEKGLDAPELLELLRQNAVEQLKVDQPKYSGLITALQP